MIANAIRETATALAAAVRTEGTLRANREALLAELTASLIGQPNSETGKPHSATSAREAARQLPQVSELNDDILDAEGVAILARGEYEAARVEAWALVREVA